MDAWFGAFALLSIVYVIVGIWYLYQVIVRWRSLWDEQVTPEDIRLATGASFFLLVPPTVFLHEVGHAAALWLQGRQVLDFWFIGYMGAVFFAPVGGFSDFVVALAGNVVTLLIGIGVIVWALQRPGHPIRNVLWIELGRQSLLLVLVIYPTICLFIPWDFKTIYDFDVTPIASGVTAGVHGLLLALGYGVVWKKKWLPRAELLKSPDALKILALEKRLRADDGDLRAHRELGMLYAAHRDAVRARLHLEKVIAAGGADARTHLAYGTALFALGEYARAIPELEAALGGLLRPEDRALAQEPLAAARARVGRVG